MAGVVVETAAQRGDWNADCFELPKATWEGRVTWFCELLVFFLLLLFWALFKVPFGDDLFLFFLGFWKANPRWGGWIWLEIGFPQGFSWVLTGDFLKGSLVALFFSNPFWERQLSSWERCFWKGFKPSSNHQLLMDLFLLGWLSWRSLGGFLKKEYRALKSSGFS